MERIKRTVLFAKTLVLFLVFSSYSATGGYAKEINLNQLEAVVETCLKLIQNGDYRGAALMYHYPPDYSQEELNNDLDGVEGSLKIFAEEFGAFREVTPLDKQTLYVNIYASGGSHQYWEEYPNVLKIEMQTEFANFGPGFLIVQLVDIADMLEVKAIAYGLPVSGESVARIKQVGDRIVLLNQQLAAKETRM